MTEFKILTILQSVHLACNIQHIVKPIHPTLGTKIHHLILAREPNPRGKRKTDVESYLLHIVICDRICIEECMH